MLKKVTIVVPPFNRPAYLERLLRLLLANPRGGEILVADSSDDEIRAGNCSMIEYYDEHGEPKISELDWTDDDQWTANR